MIDLYAEFTAVERVHLVLAAFSRGDLEEVARLRDSCPRVTMSAGDPRYTQLLDRMGHAGMAGLYRWLEVSHHVICDRLVVDLLNRLVLVETGLTRLDRGNTKELKVILRRDRELLTHATASWRKWSAAWKGIEAAITRFCAERGLTVDQFFAMTKGLPRPIDEARDALEADIRADPQWEEWLYRDLGRALSGEHPSDGE